MDFWEAGLDGSLPPYLREQLREAGLPRLSVAHGDDQVQWLDGAMVHRNSDWRWEGELRRGLCVGSIAAVGLGAIVVLCGRYLALPWSLSGFGGYRLWMRMLLVSGAGFGFTWAVAAVSERAGGMVSVVWETFAVSCAAILGIALAWVAISGARLLAGETASLLAVVVLVVLPTVAGGVIAIILRRL